MLKPVSLDKEVHDRLKSSIEDYLYPMLDLAVAHEYRRDFHVCLYQKMSIPFNHLKGSLIMNMLRKTCQSI